jgi:hypothetical protein
MKAAAIFLSAMTISFIAADTLLWSDEFNSLNLDTWQVSDDDVCVRSSEWLTNFSKARDHSWRRRQLGV